MYLPYFFQNSPFLQPNRKKSKGIRGRILRARFKQRYLGNLSELDTCSYGLLYLAVTNTVLSPSKILTFSH
jgi:hypothetical protein